MDQFAAARLKNQKRLEAMARSAANVAARPAPEKKDEPKQVSKAPEPMVLRITGPCEMTLLVDYAGTLTSGQQNKEHLKAMFKKCLLPIGRVRDAS